MSEPFFTLRNRHGRQQRAADSCDCAGFQVAGQIRLTGEVEAATLHPEGGKDTSERKDSQYETAKGVDCSDPLV